MIVPEDRTVLRWVLMIWCLLCWVNLGFYILSAETSPFVLWAGTPVLTGLLAWSSPWLRHKLGVQP